MWRDANLLDNYRATAIAFAAPSFPKKILLVTPLGWEYISDKSCLLKMPFSKLILRVFLLSNSFTHLFIHSLQQYEYIFEYRNSENLGFYETLKYGEIDPEIVSSVSASSDFKSFIIKLDRRIFACIFLTIFPRGIFRETSIF